MNRGGAETELLLVSEAVARLKGGMYAGIKQPEPITHLKKREQRLLIGSGPIGWGPQKEDAAKRVYKAIVQGELSVVVLPDDPTESEMQEAPLLVPVDVLKQMIRTRGGLPDRAFEPMRILAKGSVAPELLAALSKSKLYIRREEFDAWYEKDRQNRIWPSHNAWLKDGRDEFDAWRNAEKNRGSPIQRSRCKPRMGRPSTQNDLRKPIIALVNEGRWSARKTIADLVRLLESQGKIAARDTVRRVIDQLFKETGKQSYRRPAHTRSKVKRNGPGQGIAGT